MSLVILIGIIGNMSARWAEEYMKERNMKGKEGSLMKKRESA